MDGGGHARAARQGGAVSALAGVSRSSYMLPMPYDRTLHAVATGRAATVAALRRLAERLEALAGDDSAVPCRCGRRQRVSTSRSANSPKLRRPVGVQRPSPAG
jgi:hypothetical protein